MEPKDKENAVVFMIEHNIKATKLKVIEAGMVMLAAPDFIGEDCKGNVEDTVERLQKELEQADTKETLNPEQLEAVAQLMNEHLDGYMPTFKKAVLEHLLQQLPAEVQEYEAEQRRQDAIEELLNDVVSKMSTEQIVELVDKVKENGHLVAV